MNTLPTELILNIIYFLCLNDLKSLCVVSKLFDKICQDVNIRVDFFFIDQCQFIKCIDFISRHFNVIKIRLPPSIVTKPSLVDYASSKLKNLESLTIHCNNRFFKEDLEFFYKFQNIKELSIYSCRVSADGFENLFKLKNLKIFKVRSSLYTNYNKLTNYPENLEELSLIGPSTLLINNFNKMSKLKKIDFSSSETFIIVRKLQENILRLIGENCKLLEILKLNYCRNVNSEDLNFLLQSCNIKNLQIQGCENINSVLKNIGNLKNLVFLDISHCSNIKPHELEYLLNCTNLVKLYAYGLYYVDNKFFENIGKCLKKLTSFKFTYCNSNCIKPLTFLSQCKSLHKLFIRGKDIDPKDFDYFAENTKNYTYIDLGNCNQLSNSNLKKLNTNFLQVLDICSPNFTQEMFTEIINNSPYLKNISLYYIRDFNMDFFVKVCKNIKYVFISEHNINKDLFKTLVKMNNINFL